MLKRCSYKTFRACIKIYVHRLLTGVASKIPVSDVGVENIGFASFTRGTVARKKLKLVVFQHIQKHLEGISRSPGLLIPIPSLKGWPNVLCKRAKNDRDLH